jgi:NAD(P)-dependent dehydrogenase (short-subunit alcohol dehydrogenase family)
VRADIVTGLIFPDNELTDHTQTRRSLTALQGDDPTPMHRASQPREIAEVISFLASPRASYITGSAVAGRRAI